jgi:hypothetical protein
MAALTSLGAACGQPGGGADKAPARANASAPAPAPPARSRLLYLARGGLELVDPATGASRIVPFGTPEAEARALIEAVTGPPAARTADPHCSVQPSVRLDYRGGLALAFDGGRFAAWEQGAGAGYRMRDGLAIGASREAMRALGPMSVRRAGVTEIAMEAFTAGAIEGVLLDGRLREFTAGEGACR